MTIFRVALLGLHLFCILIPTAIRLVLDWYYSRAWVTPYWITSGFLENNTFVPDGTPAPAFYQSQFSHYEVEDLAPKAIEASVLALLTLAHSVFLLWKPLMAYGRVTRGMIRAFGIISTVDLMLHIGPVSVVLHALSYVVFPSAVSFYALRIIATGWVDVMTLLIVCKYVAQHECLDSWISFKGWKYKEQVLTSCPHMVTCCLAEYANGADAVSVRANTRTKLMRLATLPIPDRYLFDIVSGSEAVIIYLSPREAFFAGPPPPVGAAPL
jgi:hypothetical protein